MHDEGGEKSSNARSAVGRMVRHILKGCASAVVLAIVATTAPPAVAEARDFDIDAGEAARTLNEFARQAGVSIVYDYDALAGYKTNDVEGALEPRDALRKMTAGTGLVIFEGERGGAFAVRAPGQSGDLGDYVRIAQAETAAEMTIEPRSEQPDTGKPGSITGGVTDEISGANLKGALVTIEETGQTASTDGLGSFRFPSVRAGSYTLRVSYLGYIDLVVQITVEAGKPVDQAFAMTGGTALELMVVYGSRSARAQSLNQERTAENSSTVVSSDFLGQFDGTTISEALRRTPGIAFEEDPNTGDGKNVIIRGLAPDLNQITLNGLRLAEGSGRGRSPSLAGILTESIGKVTINKSLLPSHDGSGAGGLVEIETKSPFDRPRRYASFSVEGGKTGGDFAEDSLLSGTVSRILGESQNFGLSASVQYRNRDVQTLSYSVTADDGMSIGQYLPLGDSGAPASSDLDIDPRRPFSFEPGVDEIYPVAVGNTLRSIESSNLSTTLSAQWLIQGHTDLKFDFTRSDAKADFFERTATALPLVARQLLPVDKLGGELRYATVSQGAFNTIEGFEDASLFGMSHSYENRDESSTTDTYSFRGHTDISRLTLKYDLGLSVARTEGSRIESLRLARSLYAPESVVDRAFLLPRAFENTIDGRLVNLYAPLSGNGYPLPLFNQAGFDFYNSADSYLLDHSSIASAQPGKNKRYTGRLSARQAFDHENFKYLEVGAFYEDSKLTSVPGPPLAGRDFNVIAITPIGGTAADAGIDFDGQALGAIGRDGGFRVVSRSSFRRFFDGLENNPNVQLTNGQNEASIFFEPFTLEKDFATYLQGRVDIGKLEVVGGARLERVEVTARNVTQVSLIDVDGTADIEFTENSRSLVDQAATQTEILPRLAATYRQSDNLIFRLGYGVTVARPRIEDLSERQSLTIDLRPRYGPLNDQPYLKITQGNPNLEPARVSSYDLDAEYYSSSLGAVKISVFYKEIDNLLESTERSGLQVIEQLGEIELPDDPRIAAAAGDFFINFTTPVNNDEPGKIWGVETSFEQQLTFLPGAWGGLGVFANYTYTDSSKTQPVDVYDTSTLEFTEVLIPDVAFSGSPKHSGTAALTYNKYGIDATLAYTAQARRLGSYESFNLHSYDERDDSLDFRIEYLFRSWRFWLEGSDLLKGTEDPDVESARGGTGNTPKFFTNGNYLGGRMISIGLATTF